MTALRPLTLLAAAGLAACGTVTPDTAPRPVTVAFALVADGQPVGCGGPAVPLGSGPAAATLHDARFYLQDLALVDAAGTPVPVTLAANAWQTATTALIDFEDGTGGCRGGSRTTNAVVSGTVPPGRYVGLSFTVGVPSELNHTSTEKAPPPLDIAAMGWSWQAGRKFMKVEVDPAGGVGKPDGSRAATWFVHLGSTDCTGNPATGETVTCKRSNRVPVAFAAFDPANQAVALDLAALFRGSDLARDRGGAVGCMSGPTDVDCGPVFAGLGLSPVGGVPAAFRTVARP